MSSGRTDFVVAVCESFNLSSVAYVGADETVPAELQERMPNLEGPNSDGKSGVVFLDRCYANDPVAVINAGLTMVQPGGFLMGTDYTPDDETGLPVQKAIAQLFNLMLVQIGPEHVWAVRKA